MASCDEQLQGLVGDAVLGVVEEDAVGLGGEARAARRIFGEEVAQVPGLDALRVGGERLPCGALFKRCGLRDGG